MRVSVLRRELRAYIDKTGGREEKKCVIEFDSGDDDSWKCENGFRVYDSSVAANFQRDSSEEKNEERRERRKYEERERNIEGS